LNNLSIISAHARAEVKTDGKKKKSSKKIYKLSITEFPNMT